MKRTILWLFIGLFALGSAFSQDSNSGIIYGDKWSYLISAPHGFKWDNVSLQEQGIWGLFYKEDQSSFVGSKLNMYINPVMKGGDYPTDLNSLIEWDTAFFKANNPGLVISAYKDMKLGDNKTAKVFSFDDATKGYYMLYGYVTENNASFVFVLVARSKAERKAYEASYAELLRSFIYMDKK